MPYEWCGRFYPRNESKKRGPRGVKAQKSTYGPQKKGRR